ncbi:MAG: hypothetical protein SFW09_11565 [Hyphomicrobiaceae bacterium]|nr:hypothetical protein [Hyphomicrobiaceae bacterium]
MATIFGAASLASVGRIAPDRSGFAPVALAAPVEEGAGGAAPAVLVVWAMLISR